ncbi:MULTISPECIES: hypothetical protein [Mesorhizobium]|uniref:hypothetical protein n=1 Tax=Mesorhizobium TaxID=68287 RepID=UPI0003CF515C|nr:MULTISPECIES: hypothetical protein [Mesorhizobium]ESY70006.1 hypothetical protein X742_05700 [Mesorhizobium sp. LNHC232B00]WJI40291.1 hypothetical protein NL534_08635 [Mesorhizobium opportunistum]
MTGKSSTYWTERAEAADEARKAQQLEIARNMIVAGIEMALLVSGSGLQAIEEVEHAVSGWLATHNAALTAEVEAIETKGSA